MTELKPCPFCGGEARLYSTESRQSYRRAVVKCKSCGAELRREGGGFPDFPGVCDEFEKRRLSNERAKAEAVEAWNTRAATTIGQVAVEVVPTKQTCKLEPLEAFYVTVNMLDQTEWGVCSNCGTVSPIDATYCCECGRKVER